MVDPMEEREHLTNAAEAADAALEELGACAHSIIQARGLTDKMDRDEDGDIEFDADDLAKLGDPLLDIIADAAKKIQGLIDQLPDVDGEDDIDVANEDD